MAKEKEYPPKESFSAEQLAAVIEHETELGVYDGRYDDPKPIEEITEKIEEEIKGDVETSAVSEEEPKRKGGWPKGKKRG